MRVAAVALAVVVSVAGCSAGGTGTTQSPLAGQSSTTPSPTVAATLSPVPVGKGHIDGCSLPTGARRVHVTTADHVRLAGVTVGAGTRGVALFHESDGTVCNWLDFAWRLAQHHFLVLAVDSRGHGESPNGTVTPGKPERYELDGPAAVNWLRNHGASHVGIAGASVGGTLALVTAERMHHDVAAVASLSGEKSDNVRLRALAGAAALPTYVLLVIGKDDLPYLPDAKELARAAPQAQLLQIRSADHGTALLPDSSTAEHNSPTVGQVLIRFFSRDL